MTSGPAIEKKRENFYGDLEKYDLYHALKDLLESIDEEGSIEEEFQNAREVYKKVRGKEVKEALE